MWATTLNKLAALNFNTQLPRPSFSSIKLTYEFYHKQSTNSVVLENHNLNLIYIFLFVLCATHNISLTCLNWRLDFESIFYYVLGTGTSCHLLAIVGGTSLMRKKSR